MRIDAHQHFWKYNPFNQGWISDEMSILRRDYLPAELYHEIKTSDFDGTIAVQAEETYEENHFLNKLAEENDYIIGIVGWLDLLDKRAEEKMQALKSIDKLVGFRTITQGAPDEKYLSNPLYIHNVGLLAKYDYTYDLLVHHSQLTSLIHFTEQLPNNQFIIDHLGKPDIKHKEIKDWERSIKILASNPNIYCKLSGMTTEADYKNWTYADLLPYMETVAEYFGINRLCFGSDWPVCLVAGSYATTLAVVDQFCSQLKPGEKNKIFGENTKEFYKL
jgi:L-fuconolactonase